MKMQKVEIEVPVFSGMEFIRFGILSKEEADDENIKVCAATTNMDGSVHYSFLTSSRYSIGLICMIYKKKPPRRIIFEEIEVGYVKPGDVFIDDYGMPKIWDGKCCSFTNAPKLIKVHDDFEVEDENAKS